MLYTKIFWKWLIDSFFQPHSHHYESTANMLKVSQNNFSRRIGSVHSSSVNGWMDCLANVGVRFFTNKKSRNYLFSCAKDYAYKLYRLLFRVYTCLSSLKLLLFVVITKYYKTQPLPRLEKNIYRYDLMCCQQVAGILVWLCYFITEINDSQIN